ncbi:ubiquinone biosynthesis accessory factor UbiJ [Pararobbsia silviterrae]|uniref:Ubiquinone biosynthesis accessory factor UbiJ n=1 Tax=Pararobbsia silviterrae TaxID=1792498 RepID=A0A494Y8D6_9BURK|nr:sterol-binding protein [Pararobbsia silviterrae]RKP58904.1 sterol-binding protein [Pararobbsia silviterrae]
MTVAAQPAIAAINHLLAREAWAREKLVPYAGRRARIALPLGSLDLEVRADGLFGHAADASAAPGDAQPATDAAGASSAQGERAFDVTITVEAGAAPAFVSGGQAGAMKHIRIEGDAEFATALGYLAEHLRWEPEEDLAKLIGDAGAHRAASLAREVADRARRTGRNFIESIAEYLLDEDPQLVRRGELDALVHTLTQTRDAVARLEKRLERLERTSPGARPPGGAPTSADGNR